MSEMIWSSIFSTISSKFGYFYKLPILKKGKWWILLCKYAMFTENYSIKLAGHVSYDLLISAADIKNLRIAHKFSHFVESHRFWWLAFNHVFRNSNDKDHIAFHFSLQMDFKNSESSGYYLWAFSRCENGISKFFSWSFENFEISSFFVYSSFNDR